MERQKEERKRMKEEWEQTEEEWKRLEKQENQQCTRINKAFEKIPRFNGTNPSYCFDSLLEITNFIIHHSLSKEIVQKYKSKISDCVLLSVSNRFQIVCWLEITK